MLAAAALDAAAADKPPRRVRPADIPSWECPQPRGGIPEGAAAAVAAQLGAGAEILCEGDLNGDKRTEVLAAVTTRTHGKGIGFYRVVGAAAIFEEGAERRSPWLLRLLVTDRVENETGQIGWQEPPGPDRIGMRVTMSDAGRACVQLRRLDSARRRRGEEPLLLLRWDPSVGRYEPGPCRDGTAGTPARPPE